MDWGKVIKWVGTQLGCGVATSRQSRFSDVTVTADVAAFTWPAI